MYGTTEAGGPNGDSNGGGTVFELTPSNGGWAFAVLYSFAGGIGPQGGVVMNASGNLYGTRQQGAHEAGSVFKLTPYGGGWVYSDVHDFNVSDGRLPTGSLLIDSSGSLYGTTFAGGEYNYGVIFQITP